MVSTQDFESCDPGSIPGETYLTIAQLAEQWTVNPFVGCSSHPSENVSVWRNWIAHQTSNLGVAGSSPVMDIFYAQIPEWSKGVDSSSTAFMLRGFKSHSVQLPI
jgi:hypothetical protein